MPHPPIRHPGDVGVAWLFAYGSLLWRAGFMPAQWQLARVHGWHRAFAVHAVGGRGSPARPGLWLALEPGGSTLGVAFRLDTASRTQVLARLWQRELPDDAYRPVIVRCVLPDGRRVDALAFAANRHGALYAGHLSSARIAAQLVQARGPLGSGLDYLRRSQAALAAHGLRDGHVDAVCRSAEAIRTPCQWCEA